MRSLKLGLLVLVLVGGLVGLWWALGHPTPASAGGTDVELAPRADSAPAARLDPIDASPAEPRTPSPVQRAELEPPGSESGPVVDPVLVGRVLDDQGRPVAGARVLASTGQAWMLVPLRVDGPAFERTTAPRLFETSTDARGRFAFGDAMQPGGLRIAVSAPGKRPLYDDDLTLSARRPHDLGDLVVEPGIVLAGRVVDVRGEPVPGALVLEAIVGGVGGSRVSIEGRGIPLATTGASGHFRLDQLAEGPWHLIIDAPGFLVREVSGRTEADPDREPGAPAGRQEDLVFTLERGSAISGRAVGADPERLKELRVEARTRLQDREDPQTSPVPDDVSPRARSAGCDALGQFEIGGLPDGVAQVLTAWSRDRLGRWRRDPAFDPVEAWPGTTGAELNYKPPAALAFTVVDQRSDEPVTDFVAWIGVDGGAAALRDEDERVVRHHPGGRVVREDLAPRGTTGLARILVRAAGYAEREETDVVVERGELRNLGRLVLTPAPAVVVSVTDAGSGEPVADARVFLATGDGGILPGYAGEPDDDELYADTRVRFARTDERGVAVLPASAGSTCELLVVSEDHSPREVAGVFVPAGGDAQVDVALFRGATVIVEVTDDAGRSVADVPIEQAELDREDDGRRLFDQLLAGRVDPTTDDLGIVRFTHLRPGEHGFRAAREASAAVGQLRALGYATAEPESEPDWSRVVIGEGGEYLVEVRTAARGALSGRVTERGVPLAGASLRLVPAADESEATSAGGTTSTAYTEPGGDYRFTGVPAGTYELRLTHADRRMPFVRGVDVTAGSRQLDLELPVSIVQGRVTLADGDPVSGATVLVGAGEKRQYSFESPLLSLREDPEGRLRVDRHSRERRARTDEDGEYELRGVVSDVPLLIGVQAKFIVSASQGGIVVGPDDVATGVDFVVDGAGELEVRVVGSSGRGAFRVRATRVVPGAGEGDAQASGSPPPQAHGETRSTVLWGNRERRMGSLGVGTWQLELLPYDRSLSEPLARASVEVRAGETSSVALEL